MGIFALPFLVQGCKFMVRQKTRWWQLQYFLFSPQPGEMIQFDYSTIFQMGWNHQPEKVKGKIED